MCGMSSVFLSLIQPGILLFMLDYPDWQYMCPLRPVVVDELVDVIESPGYKCSAVQVYLHCIDPNIFRIDMAEKRRA